VWTRNRWDAARELFWHTKHNHFQAHLRVFPLFPNSLFIDIPLFLTEMVSGWFGEVGGNVIVKFPNHERDKDYLVAEQEKELAKFTAAGKTLRG
jgi:hypothetical protein